MKIHRRLSNLAFAFLVPLVVACDDGVSPPGTTDVTVSFSGVSATPSATSPALVGSSSGTTTSAPALSQTIEGTNGVLEIAEMHLIVAELELEGFEGACELEDLEAGGGDEDCPEFEAPPAFIQVPLDGTGVEVATEPVPFGTYVAFEFEVEDIELDEEDEDEQELTQLRNEVLAAFPEWPPEASLVVIGTFTPTGGDPAPLTTFFNAEVEVELTLDLPLVLSESGASREIFIQLIPEAWFVEADGSVMDLSALQGQTPIPSLEVEIEQGEGIEIEHD